jgi:hypothetical protein
LHEPRYGLAFLIGAAVGTPGASYLLALHHLVASKTPAAVAVIAVIVFVTINFAVVLVPAAFEVTRPQGTEGAVKRFKDWVVSHGQGPAIVSAPRVPLTSSGRCGVAPGTQTWG